MIIFEDLGTRYKMKNGIVTPRNEFSRALARYYKGLRVLTHIPDKDLEFIKEMGFEIISYEPPKYDDNLIY